MKIVCAAVAVMLASQLPVFAQAGAETEGSCGQTIDAPLRSRAVLTIDSRSAGIDITGSDSPTIHISCDAEDDKVRQDIHLKLTGSQDDAKLTVTGGPTANGNLTIRVEVPRKTNLKIKMPAGQVKIAEVAGDKDINLYAGQISISSDRAWDYRTVDLSVAIGEVKAQAYGADSGGFFRSFSKQSPGGEYSLRAHVTTGQIELLGSHAAPAPQ
jgi:hypothetical protein